jgi:hypothetical protein
LTADTFTIDAVDECASLSAILHAVDNQCPGASMANLRGDTPQKNNATRDGVAMILISGVAFVGD